MIWRAGASLGRWNIATTTAPTRMTAISAGRGNTSESRLVTSPKVNRPSARIDHDTFLSSSVRQAAPGARVEDPVQQEPRTGDAAAGRVHQAVADDGELGDQRCGPVHGAAGLLEVLRVVA